MKKNEDEHSHATYIQSRYHLDEVLVHRMFDQRKLILWKWEWIGKVDGHRCCCHSPTTNLNPQMLSTSLAKLMDKNDVGRRLKPYSHEDPKFCSL